MLVRDWMSPNVISITPDTSIMKATRLMKDKGIRRLPVVDDAGAIVGIISDRDIKAASPSKATTLDMHELHYLLSALTAKEIMTKNPICANPEDSIEQCAVSMVAHQISGMPVVNQEKALVGIITESDIFEVLISITGAKTGGLQLAFSLETIGPKLTKMIDLLHELGADILSILTSEEPRASLYIRIRPLLPEQEERIICEMLNYECTGWTRHTALT